jgi:glycosyltransferase involved in cell wall biosynthesis
MVTLHIFPSFSAYPERARTLIAAANDSNHHFIITKMALPFTCTSPDVTIVHPTRVYGALHFLFFAIRTGHSIIHALPRFEKVIIWDHFLPRVGIVLKLLFGRQQIKTCISFYASNYTLLKNRGWRTDSQRTSASRECHYISMLLSRLVCEWIAVKNYDAVTGNNQEILDSFVSLFKMPDKIGIVLPTAVDTSFFIPHVPGTSNEEKRILCVGRILLKRKGIDTILSAFSLVCQTRKDCSLHLVGDIDPYDNKEFYAAIKTHSHNDKIHIFKAVSQRDLLAHYQHATIFLSASINEGSPRTVKEALACEIPCIVSDIPGHRAIDSEGEVLRFFPPSDTTALFSLIDAALDSKKPLPGTCRHYIHTYFSVESVAAEFRSLYQQIFHDK